MKKRVEKIIALIMCAVMIFGIAPLSGFVGFGLPGLSSLISVSAKAYGGTYGDLSYEINNGTVVITDCDENALGNLVIPGTIENCPVTNVDDYAFEGCAGLTGITIPDSVTGIGDGAFSYCIGLTSVTIGNSVTSIGDHAFEHCGLTGITIPDSVTSIDDSAFSGCAGLTGITVASGNTVYHSEGDCLIETASKTLIAGCKYSIIPDDGSVTSIGDGAFTGRTGLESFTIPLSVTSIGDSAFAGCTDLTYVTIPYSVTRIGDSAFYLCAGLEDVYFTGTEEEWNAIVIGEDNTTLLNASIHFNNPDSIDPYSVLTYEINGGKVTITGCDKNASGELEIPGTIEGCPVTSIGETAFFECTLLTDITIPDSVVSIGSWAFENCNSLTSITIPDSVTSINSFAFQSCYALSSITVEEGNTKYHSAGNCLIETESKTLIAGCKNSVIPDDGSVKEIGISAFYCCFELTDIIIPDSVESIGWSAFQSCESLTSVIIGNGVKTIEDNAFLSCTRLTSITIPDSVTSISGYSFYGCNGLSDITVSEGNEKYHSAGNCLIETASKTLLLGCKNSVIPDDGSVTSINENAFSECVGLTSITIPDSVTSIGYGAFEYCYGLTDVYFTGSEEEWNAIEIGEYNDCLTNATIHYNHEHSYTSETTVTQTCTADGEITYTCECGDTYTEVVPAAGHKPASPVKENIIPATTTEGGSYDEVVYCSVCSAQLSRKTVNTPRVAFISGEVDKTAVVRGNQGVWTVKTTDDVEWLKFNGTYTTSSGYTYNSSVYFKAANYMNATEGVTVSDNNGERTWTVPMTFNFSGTDDTVTQTWSVTYKVKNSSVWVDSPYSQEITVGKTEQSIAPQSDEYAPYSLVSVNSDFTEIGKGARGNITIVTTIDCNKVRVTYTDAATGKAKATTFQTTSKNNVSFTDDETTGLRTWTISFKFAAPALNNEFKVDTRGVEWTETKTVNVEVK